MTIFICRTWKLRIKLSCSCWTIGRQLVTVRLNSSLKIRKSSWRWLLKITRKMRHVNCGWSMKLKVSWWLRYRHMKVTSVPSFSFLRRPNSPLWRLDPSVEWEIWEGSSGARRKDLWNQGHHDCTQAEVRRFGRAVQCQGRRGSRVLGREED